MLWLCVNRCPDIICETSSHAYAVHLFANYCLIRNWHSLTDNGGNTVLMNNCRSPGQLYILWMGLLQWYTVTHFAMHRFFIFLHLRHRNWIIQIHSRVLEVMNVRLYKKYKCRTGLTLGQYLHRKVSQTDAPLGKNTTLSNLKFTASGGIRNSLA